jgi:hypothetical protein
MVLDISKIIYGCFGYLIQMDLKWNCDVLQTCHTDDLVDFSKVVVLYLARWYSLRN